MAAGKDAGALTATNWIINPDLLGRVEPYVYRIMCRPCASDMLGCRSCTNGSVCLACTDQYYLSTATNLCIQCIYTLTACVSCYNATNCYQCL